MLRKKNIVKLHKFNSQRPIVQNMYISDHMVEIDYVETKTKVH